jgi:biopolymer transport protein ExbD
MRSVFLLASVALSLSLSVTGCDEEPEVPEESPDPVVGIMELPISFRHDSSPQSPLRIEVSPSKMRVEAHTVLELTGGRIPDEEVDGMRIRSLVTAIEAAPARGSAALRLHANTPYRTMALVLATLQAAGLREIGIEVRRGQTTDTGFLKIGAYDVREESEEWASFDGPYQRQWDELEPVWGDMYTECRDGPYVDCAYKSSSVAEGGQMQITLFARGNGVKIELHRHGAEEAAPAPQPVEMLEGITPPPGSEEVEEDPATTAAFTWRFQSTTTENGAVGRTLRPLCGSTACGVVVTAESQTPTMRIVSFLGAAFPNGVPGPSVLFQIPE